MELKIRYKPNIKIQTVKEGIAKQIDLQLVEMKKQMLETFKMSTLDKEAGFYKLIIKSKNILDFSEKVMLDTLRSDSSPYKVVGIKTFSKSFVDLHDNENQSRQEFRRALKHVEDNMGKTHYVKKGENFWWVGTKSNKSVLELSTNDLFREAYRIGCGLGLVPQDLTISEPHLKVENDDDDDNDSDDEDEDDDNDDDEDYDEEEEY